MKLKLSVVRPVTRLLPALLALSACGPVVGPSVSGKIKNSAVIQSSVVDLQKFSSDCSGKNGVLMADNTVCVTANTQSLPSSNGNVQDLTIEPNFLPGMGIRASGNGTSGLLQIQLNSAWVANVPQTAFYRINGSGRLHLIAQPGSWTGVTVTVYTCYDQYMQQVYCPAL